MSLRLRLTLLTAVLIAVASSALGIAIYTNASSIQMERIDGILYGEIAEARIRALEDGRAVPRGDVYVQVAIGRLDRDQTIVTLRPAGTADDPIPVPDLTAEQIAEARVDPITVEGSPNMRVALQVQRPGRPPVIAAAPLTESEQTLASLAQAIIVAVVSVTVVGALAAWFLVWIAFRPMRAMITSATRIADGETDHRLPESPPGTEIGDLTHSMNVMIDSLAVALAEAAASEDRLRTFVSDASHEIRTPLTVIRGYSELIARRSDELGDQDRAALARIESESMRLDRLVTQLLALEAHRSRTADERDVVDLGGLAEVSFADLAVLDPDREVTMSTVPAEVWAVPDDLRLVLANLAQNLVRHTPEGSPAHVTVTHDRDTVTLIVDDSGPGIPEARRRALLDPSSTRHKSSSTEGFGLGLRIMVEAVEENGGTMELGDSPMGGLRVTITLPSAAHRAGHPTE